MATEVVEAQGEVQIPTREDLNAIFREKIKDPRILQAFLDLDRAEFMPEEYKEVAYLDRAQNIGENTSISQPTLVAMMVELLQLKGGERVFELGTATGYEAAILSLLGCEVYTTDIQQELCGNARFTLDKLGINGINIFAQDGAGGIPDHAPFDAIIISAALRYLPQELFFQLRDGGAIVAPVGKDPAIQQLVRGVREGEKGLVKVVDKVWFHKVMSPVEGAWEPEILERSIQVKETFFRDLIDNLSQEEKADLLVKIEEVNKERPEGEEEITLDNFYQISCRIIRLPDEFYEEALGEEHLGVSDTEQP